MSNKDIADRLDVNINTVKLCLSKYLCHKTRRPIYAWLLAESDRELLQ